MAKSAKITDFFNVKKTIEFVDVPIVDKDTTISNSFYKDCLTEKINQNKCDDNCEIRKIELKNLLQQEKIKLYNLEKALSSCLFIIDIKNDKISKLMEKTQTESTFNGAEITESVSKSTMNITTNVRTPQKSPKSPYRISADLFKSHENNFSAIQLAQLRSLGREMRSDSTFILRVMRFLYDDDITALKGVSVCGVSKKGQNKKAVDSTKYATVEKMFEERLSSLLLTKTEKDIRTKRLNILLKSAIINITKKDDKQEILSIETSNSEQIK